LSLRSEWAKAPGAVIDKLRTATLRGEMNIATLRSKCRSGPRRVVMLARMSHSLSRGAPYGQLRLKPLGSRSPGGLKTAQQIFWTAYRPG
jgi:hypothetical protein